jgi:hypothetical protein
MSQKIQYQCPTCKTLNNSEVSNCIKCGHWLHSTSFPPKAVKKKSVIRRIFKIFGISIASIIGLFIVLMVIVAITNSDKTNHSKSAQSAAIKKPKVVYGGRKSPVPLGTELSYRIEQSTALTGMNKHEFGVTVQVNVVVRGKEANDKVKAWNELNEKPKEGFEYLIVRTTIGVTDSKDDGSLAVNQNTFSLVSGGGIKYDDVMVVVSESAEAKMYEGAKHTGWTAFLVRKDDAFPLIEAAGMWFVAYN